MLAGGVLEPVIPPARLGARYCPWPEHNGGFCVCAQASGGGGDAGWEASERGKARNTQQPPRGR